MRLIFVFTNLTSNTLNDFLKDEFIKDFIEIRSGESILPEEHILSQIEAYDSILPALENEILQVIETTNQETIDSYFKTLIERKETLDGNFQEDNVKRIYLEIEKEGRHLGEYLQITKSQSEKYFSIVNPYIKNYVGGEVKSKFKENQLLKPLLFVEGNHDIKFLQRAAELLGETELLNKIEIRQRGGYSNLDKLWDVLKQDSWEPTPQLKIFLYDCDTNKKDEDFGHIFKRIVKTKTERRINRGIENLFSDDFIKKSENYKPDFIDFKIEYGRERGKEFKTERHFINKDEKTNFCEWACENGDKDDFKDFADVFNIIREIIE